MSDEVSLEFLQRRIAQLAKSEHERPLRSGGGGGTFDDMEQRVAKLEQGYDKLRDDIGGLRTDLAVLTERVSHLPTKGFIITAASAALAFGGALILFQDRLVAFFGI